MSTPAIRGIVAPVSWRLLLALFMFGVAADHPHRSFAADDFAVLTDAFDAGSDFHVYRLTGKVVRESKDEYCSTIPVAPQAGRGPRSDVPAGATFDAFAAHGLRHGLLSVAPAG